MEQDYIWNLIAKKLAREASPEELMEIERQLRKYPELHYPMQTVVDLWEQEQHASSHNREAGDAFSRHIERMQHLNIDYQVKCKQDPDAANYIERNKKFFIWPILSLFVIAFAIFSGLRFFRDDVLLAPNPSKHAEKPISEISTKNGFKTNLILPDGTKVWLNAGSSLKYDSAYGKTIREVALSGEAFFDVVKNKDKPFIIHASKINIKVLGTEFNVRSYPSDKTTEASLIRGSIEVTFKDKPNKKIILKPNEKIVVENEGRLGNIMETSHQDNFGKANEVREAAVKNLTYEHKTGAIIETSWVENKLIFQDESFEDIARQLERWYGVSIRFEKQQLKENHLTGSFKNETIRQALDALKFTASFNYEIDNNNNITIF
jgi:transmembrane sensor